MKTCFFIFCTSIICLISTAQDTTRILFIGNSFTYYNNMPQMVKSFADSAGIPIITGMHAPGGVSVGDTVQGNMAHMNNPVLFQLIRSKKWDFAVIQDNQGRFVRDSAVFPGSSMVVQGHLNIMDSVKANNSCAKIILFGGWAFKYGSPPFGNTGIEMIQRILRNYVVLNDTMKEVIAPIGDAWIKAVNYLPAVNLWDPDDAHPSYSGSYLTASVIFSTIFDLPAKTLNYNGFLPALDAYKLRAFGDSSIFAANFHSKYNLGGVKKLEPLYAGGQFYLQGNFSSYRWYKNGAFISNSSILNVPGNGIYKAEVIENDGCIVKTCIFNFLTTGISASEDSRSNILVFPNPATGGSFRISSDESVQRIELFSSTGAKENITVKAADGEFLVSTSGLKPGYYTVLIETKHQLIRKKLVFCD